MCARMNAPWFLMVLVIGGEPPSVFLVVFLWGLSWLSSIQLPCQQRASSVPQKAHCAMQGPKWQPGQRKQHWHSLSSIEPAAAWPAANSVGSSLPLRGVTPQRQRPNLSPVRSPPLPPESPVQSEDPGECEMQPLVGGVRHSDAPEHGRANGYQTAAAQPPDSLPSDSRLDSRPVAVMAGGTNGMAAAANQRSLSSGSPLAMQYRSPNIEDLPSDRQETDIPFGRPAIGSGEITSCEVSPGSGRSSPPNLHFSRASARSSGPDGSPRPALCQTASEGMAAAVAAAVRFADEQQPEAQGQSQVRRCRRPGPQEAALSGESEVWRFKLAPQPGQGLRWVLDAVSLFICTIGAAGAVRVARPQVCTLHVAHNPHSAQ